MTRLRSDLLFIERKNFDIVSRMKPLHTQGVFTPTAHLVVTFGFSLSIMMGVTLLGVLTVKIEFVSILVPRGIPPNISPYIGSNRDTKLYDKGAIFRSSVRGECICLATKKVSYFHGLHVGIHVWNLVPS